MFHCCTRIQSQIGYGFFIFLSKPTNPPPLLFNTTHPCLHLRLNRTTTLTFLLRCLQSSSPTRNLRYPVTSTDYLLKTLDLSPTMALKIEKRKPIELKSVFNADSVISIFRDCGFSDTHMASIFSVSPRLLSYDPHRVLVPKFDFFAENGISGDALVRIITNDPVILTRSLPRIIAPCFDFLLAFFGGDTGAVVSLFSVKRGTWVLHNFSDTTAPNVEALRRFGVPDANIVKLFLVGVRTLARETDEFAEILREIGEMGFNPESGMFVYGLRAFTMAKKEKWVSKVELLKKSFGWSHEEVQAMFVKEPNFMSLSEERLKEGLELFMNRLNWTAEDIAKYPSLLSASFDTKICPRLSVLEILISRGLEKRTCMGYAFRASENTFLKRFIERHEEDVPELLRVYNESLQKKTCVGYAFRASEEAFLRIFVERNEVDVPELLLVYNESMINRKDELIQPASASS